MLGLRKQRRRRKALNEQIKSAEESKKMRWLGNRNGCRVKRVPRGAGEGPKEHHAESPGITAHESLNLKLLLEGPVNLSWGAEGEMGMGGGGDPYKSSERLACVPYSLDDSVYCDVKPIN